MLRDMMPFMLAAAAVMTVTHFATVSIHNLWLLLAARIVLAAVLYYAIMRIARVQILLECEQFLMRRRK
jgi:hypothetical protein